MPISFDNALKFVLKQEGGYSNHPADKGGATNKGIIQSVYNRYRRDKNLSIRSVKDIEDKEVKEIYENQYWDKIRAQYIKAPLGLVLFDTAVNFGVSGSIRRLQKALDVPVTGSWTQNISDVIHTCDAGKIALVICRMRMDWRNYIAKHDPSQKVFLKGWLNRDNELASEVRRMIGAGILEVEDEEFEDAESREFDDETLMDVAQEDLR
jgi:lysozyme family protein